MKKQKTEAQKYGWYKRELKNAWNRSPMKWEAYARAKLKPSYVRCEQCGEETYWKLAEIDHIEPVVSVEDIKNNIAVYAARLNCPASGLQVLCEKCHSSKTNAEKKQRKNNRDAA